MIKKVALFFLSVTILIGCELYNTLYAYVEKNDSSEKRSQKILRTNYKDVTKILKIHKKVRSN